MTDSAVNNSKRFAAAATQEADLATVEAIHVRKTGALMGAALGNGLHGTPWSCPPPAHVERAAAFMLFTELEPSVLCPVSMTYAVTPALRANAAVGGYNLVEVKDGTMSFTERDPGGPMPPPWRCRSCW